MAISVCGNAAGLTDLVMYAWLDINLAKAVHNIVNAVLFAVFQVPSITAQRCLNNNRDLVMCLPDFHPPINMLAAGVRNLGMLLDNFIDVSTIIVSKSVGIDPKAECEAQVLNPPS